MNASNASAPCFVNSLFGIRFILSFVLNIALLRLRISINSSGSKLFTRLAFRDFKGFLAFIGNSSFSSFISLISSFFSSFSLIFFSFLFFFINFRFLSKSLFADESSEQVKKLPSWFFRYSKIFLIPKFKNSALILRPKDLSKGLSTKVLINCIAESLIRVLGFSNNLIKNSNLFAYLFSIE